LAIQSCPHNSAIFESSSNLTGISVAMSLSSFLSPWKPQAVASIVFFTPAKALSKLIALSLALLIKSATLSIPVFISAATPNPIDWPTDKNQLQIDAKADLNLESFSFPVLR
jgi:hypothetical protein